MINNSNPFSYSGYTYKVKVQIDTHGLYWDWCCKTLAIGQWKKMIGFMGESATYCFTNAEDATAFKLKFGL